MSNTMATLTEGIQEIFPDAEDIAITPDTLLGELPEWDSMVAVNLQSFIDQSFHVTVPLEVLGEETKIGELVAYIEQPEMLAAA